MKYRERENNMKMNSKFGDKPTTNFLHAQKHFDHSCFSIFQDGLWSMFYVIISSSNFCKKKVQKWKSKNHVDLHGPFLKEWIEIVHKNSLQNLWQRNCPKSY